MTQINTDYHGFFYLNPFDPRHQYANVFEFSKASNKVGIADGLANNACI